jgi:hypothetical protein
MAPVEICSQVSPDRARAARNLVQCMLSECREMLAATATSGEHIQCLTPSLRLLAERWRVRLWDNELVASSLSPQMQDVWLQNHLYGSFDQSKDGQTELIKNTLERFASAETAFATGQINREQRQFRLEVAIEDCVYFSLGIENPAD